MAPDRKLAIEISQHEVALYCGGICSLLYFFFGYKFHEIEAPLGLQVLCSLCVKTVDLQTSSFQHNLI